MHESTFKRCQCSSHELDNPLVRVGPMNASKILNTKACFETLDSAKVDDLALKDRKESRLDELLLE